jgi:hypothetical protein
MGRGVSLIRARAALHLLQSLRPLRHRRQGRLCLRDHQAALASQCRRQPASRARRVHARLLLHLYTRIYSDGKTANAGDPAQDFPADRRATLIATHKPGASALYALDIRLQGHGETVFLRRLRQASHSFVKDSVTLAVEQSAFPRFAWSRL